MADDISLFGSRSVRSSSKNSSASGDENGREKQREGKSTIIRKRKREDATLSSKKTKPVNRKKDVSTSQRQRQIKHFSVDVEEEDEEMDDRLGQLDPKSDEKINDRSENSDVVGNDDGVEREEDEDDENDDEEDVKFETLGLHEWLIKTCVSIGIKRPTEIQR